MAEPSPSPAAPSALVTGANRGLGLALVKALRARGLPVIAVCRHSSEVLDELGATVVDGIDLGDDASVGKLQGALATAQVQLLISNAAILEADTLETLDWDACRKQYDVNALGHLRLARAVLPRLTPTAKVAIVTSQKGSAATRAKPVDFGYCMSRAGTNMAGRLLALELQPRGIPLVMLHPGAMLTDMFRSYHASQSAGGKRALETEVLSLDDAAGRVLRALDELTLERTGRFINQDGEVVPW